MDYEINSETLAIMPINGEQAYVMEPEEEYYVNCQPFDIIEHSCEYFGSTYQGRSLGTYHLIGLVHKNPIIIEESCSIVFFPTISPKRPECIWLSYDKICNYTKGEEPRTTLVEFTNGQKIVVPISINSFSNQYLRAGRLKNVISSRKIKNS